MKYLQMFFNSDKAFAFLINNGYVYTIRKMPNDFKIKLVTPVEIHHHRDEVCKAMRFFVCTLDSPLIPGKLIPYSRGSGFGSAIEWLDEVRKFNQYKKVVTTWVLYIVTNISEPDWGSFVLQDRLASL